jgi:predicted SnoaL-like aldol condensation-catalyzing enzyme
MDASDPVAIATDFLQRAARGDVDAAWRHLAPGFLHHNPSIAGSADALKQAMAENAGRFPGKTLTARRVLRDGEQVMVLSEVHHVPGDAGYAVAHLFRFEDGRIAELWDLAQAIPSPPVNANGVF